MNFKKGKKESEINLDMGRFSPMSFAILIIRTVKIDDDNERRL